MSGNLNSTTTIKEVFENDLYDDIYLQSFGNTHYIYQIKYFDNGWKYRPAFKYEMTPDGYVFLETFDKYSSTYNFEDSKWCTTTATNELREFYRDKRIESILS